MMCSLSILVAHRYHSLIFFFLNDPPPPEISPLPQHPPLPISAKSPAAPPITPRSNQALYSPAGPETGATASAAPALPPQVRSGPSGIALQMTECEVVRVAG